MDLYRKALLQEIEFWWNMLLESGLSQDSPEYQRMQDAFELAQLRLETLPDTMGSDKNDLVTVCYH